MKTLRLVLRELQPEDEEAIFRNFSDEEVVRFFIPPLQNRAEAGDLLAGLISGFYQQEQIFWAITLKEDGAFLGTCSFESFRSNARGEISYDLGRAYWDKGYMREALVEVIRYGFEELGLHEIEAFIDPLNARSIRQVEKLEFSYASEHEGELRYKLTRKRWLKRK